MNKDSDNKASEIVSELSSPQEDTSTTGTAAPQAQGESTPETSPAPSHDTALLQEQLLEEKAKAAENWDKYLRATAEFDNYKKRVAKDRAEATKYAQMPLVQRLLTVLDNFEMALNAAGQANEENAQSFKTGVAMIFQQLKTALADTGLSEVDAQGQAFDPNLHEAIMQQESTEIPEGHVLQQLRKGYKLHDRLLRPASVVVAKAPDSATASPDPNESAQA